jgi:ribosomal-protein-alanine N-acetyltransferase
MPELKRLRADHAPAVLAFEVVNRGDEAGVCAFHVLVAEDGSAFGRFNLVDIENGTADLGYRVARHATGRGVATATVRELCRLAATRYGLETLCAATSHDRVGITGYRSEQ